MADAVSLDFEQGIQSQSGIWYKNLQLLGTGGNAVTFLMIATAGDFKGVPFAVKVFRKLSKPERKESFFQEAEFLRTCNHPAVMRVFDEGIYRQDHPFLVAEYLPRTVADQIKAGAANTVEKICYVVQLLSALGHLASLKPAVVHRDIKPRNIFIKGQSCVLGDFGLMKHLQAGDEEDRMWMKESVGAGMPFFHRTPDMVRYARGDADLTAKSDVFQLGLVAAELFTGRNPQRRAEHDDFLSPVLLDPVGRIPGSFAPSVANLISNMLQPDPVKRQSAAQLIDPWQGLFFAAAKTANALDGSVL